MNLITDEVVSKVINIFDKYPDAYSDEEKDRILKDIGWIDNNNFYGYMLREIYDELGIIKKQNNLYLGFIKLLKKEFGLNKDILEIGGGILPRLSSRISLKQKNGSITVYDPRLAYTETNNNKFILVKEKFTMDKLPNECDLIIGVQPYGGTETIIETACRNNIDFMIALGDLEGNEFANEYEFGSLQNELISNTKKLVKKYNLGELKEAEVEQYGSLYPIIYNKRK
ncbi:MAG: hypothetical protein IJF92_05270 [Bacilli bacterium]|nr:hypothetical protein [Bacilli bacterium]